ncbi:YqzL family protein [Halobacillus sp. MO56]
MLDLPWKVFSQTGNIETYLLMKEMEKQAPQEEESQEQETVSGHETNF